jgi:dipeptidyl aminopeptidase/acylaminoacyl peptidase
LEDGETFIAYDIDVRAWKVYDVAGKELRTLVTLPPETAPYVTAHLDASSRGDVAILTRSTPPDRLPSVLINTVLLDLDSLAETPLAGPPGRNAYHTFSPDGRRLAFTNENAGQGFLMVGNVNEGDATILRSASLPDDLSIPIQWSPDGSQLLIRSNGPDPSNPSYEVIDLSGASVWQLDVPAGLSFTGVQWAGPGRVLIDQQDPIADVAPPISRRLIPIADGGELPLPASLFNAALRVSPNGLYAVAIGRARNADQFDHRYDVRCSLVDLDSGTEIASEENLPVGYCGTVDWTLDSRFVIITGGGN